MVYFIDKTNRGYHERTSRFNDIKQLDHEARTNPDATARAKARDLISVLVKEDKPIRDMREALIREHRKGNVDNVKDIHEIVSTKRKYRNE